MADVFVLLCGFIVIVFTLMGVIAALDSGRRKKARSQVEKMRRYHEENAQARQISRVESPVSLGDPEDPEELLSAYLDKVNAAQTSAELDQLQNENLWR